MKKFIVTIFMAIALASLSLSAQCVSKPAPGETAVAGTVTDGSTRTITYDTKGTCSRQIIVTLDADDVITEVKFIGGCPGNTAGICALVKGMKATEAIAKLEGVLCGKKTTSCPDQLAQALKEALENKKSN